MDRRDFLKRGGMAAAITASFPALSRIVKKNGPRTEFKKAIDTVTPNTLGGNLEFPISPVNGWRSGWSIFAARGGISCGYKSDTFGAPLTPMYYLSDKNGLSRCDEETLNAAVEEHENRLSSKE